jgi:long-chain acyl-CoA synthetase
VEAMQSVTYCFSAAASMPEKVAHEWKDALGLDMHEGYGLTESTPFATYNHEIRHKFGSVGTSIMNVEVQIIGESGRKLPAGEPGEILIRGPNIMKEYFGKPKETQEAVKDGWLRTGDIGYLDDEGYLFLVDRLKDMINNAGLKVWPREVEEVLYHNPKVRECAVIGVPHDIYGETVKAVISTTPGVELTKDEVQSYAKEHLSDYKVPRVVEFVDELPKNATGKIMKRELRG